MRDSKEILSGNNVRFVLQRTKAFERRMDEMLCSNEDDVVVEPEFQGLISKALDEFLDIYIKQERLYNYLQ